MTTEEDEKSIAEREGDIKIAPIETSRHHNKVIRVQFKKQIEQSILDYYYNEEDTSWT